jgi:hypothetical protein
MPIITTILIAVGCTALPLAGGALVLPEILQPGYYRLVRNRNSFTMWKRFFRTRFLNLKEEEAARHLLNMTFTADERDLLVYTEDTDSIDTQHIDSPVIDFKDNVVFSCKGNCGYKSPDPLHPFRQLMREWERLPEDKREKYDMLLSYFRDSLDMDSMLTRVNDDDDNPIEPMEQLDIAMWARIIMASDLFSTGGLTPSGLRFAFFKPLKEDEACCPGMLKQKPEDHDTLLTQHQELSDRLAEMHPLESRDVKTPLNTNDPADPTYNAGIKSNRDKFGNYDSNQNCMNGNPVKVKNYATNLAMLYQTRHGLMPRTSLNERAARNELDNMMKDDVRKIDRVNIMEMALVLCFIPSQNMIDAQKLANSHAAELRHMNYGTNWATGYWLFNWSRPKVRAE